MKPKVLVVDDKQEDRDKLREVLEKKYQLEESASGEEALEKLTHTPDIDLVLLDVYMPDDMEVGLEILEMIKRLDSHIKVIMVTIEGRIWKASEYMQAGASNFITKPFSPSVLLKIISMVLGETI